MMRLQLFGRPQLHGLAPADGRAAQRQRLALLALLAVARDAGVTRDRLIGLLWPEADTARGRHLLSNSVYILRQAFGGDVITASADGLRLDSARLPSDVASFLDAVDRGDDDAAVQHCGSPFMEGFFLPDAAEFDRWLEGERDRLARACAAAHERRAERAEAAGTFREAADRWRRLAALDPYSSRIALRLMQALARSGDPAAAVAHARAHARQLREDLDAEPAPEVSAFAASLGRPAAESLERASPPAPTAPSPAPAAAAPPAAPMVRRRRSRRPAILAAAALLVLLAVAMLYRREGTPARAAAAAATAADPAHSIAVLPFVNLSGRAEDEYFSDGLTEELLNLLSQVQGLRVAARTSAFAFKGVNADIGEIGRQLNVEYVVEGSVRRTAERVRITAQLVRVADGYHVGSWTYEQRALADVFEIQDEISSRIVTSVLPHVAPAPLAAHGSTRDVIAFDHYAKGRYVFWQGATAENLELAIGHYRAAIERDPGYALAHAGLADAYMLLPGPPRENLPRAKAAALRALELDDELSEGYVALASISWFYDWDWAAAERNYRRSFSVNRAVYTRCICYAWYLYVLGDTEGAVREARRARTLDPVALLPLATLAEIYLASGGTDELGATLDELRAAGATAETLDYFSTWLAWRERRYDAAVAQVEQLRAGRTPDAFVAATGPWAAAGYAIMYADAGRRADARAIAAAMRAQAASRYVPSVQLAAAFAAAGDTAEAARWIRAAYRERANLAYFEAIPQSTPLRALPAFHAVLDSVRVPGR